MDSEDLEIGVGQRRRLSRALSNGSAPDGGPLGWAAKTKRRLLRAFYYIVFFVTDGSLSVLLMIAKYIRFVRSFMRKRLAKPLRRLRSRALSESRRLPPAKLIDITTMDADMKTRDGVTLHGTLYLPIEPDHDCEKHGQDLSGTVSNELGESRWPTILVRTPYGRHNLGPLWAQIFAERGYVCLLQDTRGRADSGGDFFPIKWEKQDGGDTIEWIRQQPWSNGKVALFGVSYLGLTCYAGAGSGQKADAIVPVMTCSKTHSLLYHNDKGSLSLDLALRWLWLVVKLMDTINVYKFWVPGFQQELNQAMMTLPLKDQDAYLMGETVGFVQEAIRATKISDTFWHDKNDLCDLSGKAGYAPPPAHIVAGWYDFFCKQSFADFDAACKGPAAEHCRLTVGRWKHWDFLQYGAPSIKLALTFFDKHIKGIESEEEEDLPAPDAACIHVGFLGTTPTRWVGCETWPPEKAMLCLYPLGKMARGKPALNAEYSGYRYDPQEPTPSLGGPSFDPHNGGRVEQSSLEARMDVLSFTSVQDNEEASTYVCGDVFVELHAMSSNPHTDFFFKLCDVEPDGASYNLVEGIHRFAEGDWDGEDEDGFFHVRHRVKLGPIANCFKPGHSIRLLVSGGAHPLYLRNYGTGHCIAEGTELRTADHRIFHDTKLVLPVIAKSDVELMTMSHPAYPSHVVELAH